MKSGCAQFCAFLLCALVLMTSLFIPGLAQSTDILYDDSFDTVCKLGESNSCYSTQGFAAGEKYLYSAQIGDNDARAVIYRIDPKTGAKTSMTDSTTGKTYFTNLKHANDMDILTIDGQEYLCVLTSAEIGVLQIDGTYLRPYAAFKLMYNGSSFDPGSFAIHKVDDKNITFLFKWATTISSGTIPLRATSGNISVGIKGYTDVTKVLINGEKRDFSKYTRQGIFCRDDTLFIVITGNHQESTNNESVILGYDLRKCTGSNYLQPESDQIFYLISEEYPALFEVEDGAITDGGKMYFNTNSRLTSSNTKHDGVFVLNNYSFYESTVRGEIISAYPGVAATIQLKQGDTVKYTTVAETADGNQTFSLGVLPGTYDLVCRKPGYLPFTVTGVPVGETALDLTTLTGNVAAIQPIAGDINGDGSIDLVDVATLTSSHNYSLPIQDAADPYADLNGDGLIDLQDLVIVTSSNNYGKAPTTVPFLPLPHYGSPDKNVNFLDLGDNVLMLYIEQTNAQEFEAYCTAMKNAGYTEFANRQYGNNLHAIYTSEEKVVHATYAGKEKAARIAIEDAYDMSIFTEQPYEAVCEPSVTMIGQENYAKDDNGFYYQKGMSLIFLLEDGRFIIVDGGGHNKTSLNSLYTTLQNLAVDKDNITIAAWIITHAHTDHVGTFLKFTAAGYHKSIRVENIIHHFTTTTQHTLLGEEARAPQAREVFATEYANTNIIKAHTGQKIYAGGAEIEMLFTFADLEPTVLDDFNATSLMFRVTMQGKTVMILGDSTTRSSNHLVNTYGDYLKSDIVQIAHHGKTGGTVALYETIDADVLLWPGGVANFNGDGNMDCLRTRDYNAKALELAEEAYIAGANIFTLIMPYTPEDGETTRIIY